MKLIAIFSGGDWNDANVEHLVADNSFNLKQAHIDYQFWYKNVYCPSYDKTPMGGLKRRLDSIPFLDFAGWLKKYRFVRDADEQDIEVFQTY